MSQSTSQWALSRKLVFIILFLFIIGEFLVFMVAWNSSGKKYMLQIQDNKGVVLYETKGDTLTRFDRYYFEQNFGPLASYNIHLLASEVPFPLTAWLFAAIGLPTGLILFLAFFVKAWRSLFYREEDYILRKDRISVKRPGIFTLAAFIFIFVLALWVLPLLFSRIIFSVFDFILKFKWFFLIFFSGLLLLGFWFLYLRYRLASKAMEMRQELERLKLELEAEKSFSLNGGDLKLLSDKFEEIKDDI